MLFVLVFTWLHSARTRSCSSLDRLANSLAMSTELIEAAPGEVSESFSDPSENKNHFAYIKQRSKTIIKLNDM